jgi:hypothetical protein
MDDFFMGFFLVFASRVDLTSASPTGCGFTPSLDKYLLRAFQKDMTRRRRTPGKLDFRGFGLYLGATYRASGP